jgi:hypothetical protein
MRRAFETEGVGVVLGRVNASFAVVVPNIFKIDSVIPIGLYPIGLYSSPIWPLHFCPRMSSARIAHEPESDRNCANRFFSVPAFVRGLNRVWTLEEQEWTVLRTVRMERLGVQGIPQSYPVSRIGRGARGATNQSVDQAGGPFTKRLEAELAKKETDELRTAFRFGNVIVGHIAKQKGSLTSALRSASPFRRQGKAGAGCPHKYAMDDPIGIGPGPMRSRLAALRSLASLTCCSRSRSAYCLNSGRSDARVSLMETQRRIALQ